MNHYFRENSWQYLWQIKFELSSKNYNFGFGKYNSSKKAFIMRLIVNEPDVLILCNATCYYVEDLQNMWTNIFQRTIHDVTKPYIFWQKVHSKYKVN